VNQGITKRCSLSLLTNSDFVYQSQCGGMGVSANEYSYSHHVTLNPNKLWRSTSMFNLCCESSLGTKVLSVSSHRYCLAKSAWRDSNPRFYPTVIVPCGRHGALTTFAAICLTENRPGNIALKSWTLIKILRQNAQMKVFAVEFNLKI
jgi:hypothetical protein